MSRQFRSFARGVQGGEYPALPPRVHQVSMYDIETTYADLHRAAGSSMTNAGRTTVSRHQGVIRLKEQRDSIPLPRYHVYGRRDRNPRGSQDTEYELEAAYREAEAEIEGETRERPGPLRCSDGPTSPPLSPPQPFVVDLGILGGAVYREGEHDFRGSVSTLPDSDDEGIPLDLIPCTEFPRRRDPVLHQAPTTLSLPREHSPLATARIHEPNWLKVANPMPIRNIGGVWKEAGARQVHPSGVNPEDCRLRGSALVEWERLLGHIAKGQPSRRFLQVPDQTLLPITEHPDSGHHAPEPCMPGKPRGRQQIRFRGERPPPASLHDRRILPVPPSTYVSTVSRRHQAAGAQRPTPGSNQTRAFNSTNSRQPPYSRRRPRAVYPGYDRHEVRLVNWAPRPLPRQAPIDRGGDSRKRRRGQAGFLESIWAACFYP